MKKSLEVILNIGYWFCYALIATLILTAVVAGSNRPDNLNFISKVILCFVVVPSLLSFYLNYLFVFPKYVNKQKWKKSILAFLVSIGTASIISALCMTVFVSSNSMWGPEPIDTITKFLFVAVLAMLNGILSLVIKGFVTWYTEVNLKNELNQKNKAIELALVKAKMDPHFLFNSLNNVDELINSDSKKASLYLNKLAEILRFSIYKSGKDLVSLEEEINYLKQYIDLQKIRNSNPEFVQLSIEGQYSNKLIAPMLFIPFVENAFKYSGNRNTSNAITIGIKCLASKVLFQCSNIYDKNKAPISESKGVGNDLIEKRLMILYPNNHSLKIDDNNEVYQIKLEINV